MWPNYLKTYAIRYKECYMKKKILKTFAASHGERTRGLVVPGSDQAALFARCAIAQRENKVGIRTIASSHLRECCVAWAEFTRVWRSGTYAGRPGHNGCRVGESILATWMSQNLSRGSDTLVENVCLFVPNKNR